MSGAATLCVSEVPPKIHVLVKDADHVDATCNQTVKQNMGAGGRTDPA
jgi:hypothetical protein